MLRSDFCDCSDVYIVMKNTIDLWVDRNNDTTQKTLVFKSNAACRACISKINNAFIDNAEDLNTVMPMYNLVDYTQPAYIGPQDIPRMSPSSIHRTSLNTLYDHPRDFLIQRADHVLIWRPKDIPRDVLRQPPGTCFVRRSQDVRQRFFRGPQRTSENFF